MAKREKPSWTGNSGNPELHPTEWLELVVVLVPEVEVELVLVGIVELAVFELLVVIGAVELVVMMMLVYANGRIQIRILQ
ncbi:MAG: hypothetical protein ABSB29_05375 [Nitrososphaerales archaeon]